MKVSQRLWQIFGPIIVALILVAAVLLNPFNMQRASHRQLQQAASSLSVNVFKGQSIKNQAFNGSYVPFFGSSELSRIDPLHPSVLAKKYHRSYTPFLLGKAGSTSFSQYLAIQTSIGSLKNKRAVFIISPQWFTKQRQSAGAFSYFYSPLGTVDWLLSAHNTVADRYAAHRLIMEPTIQNSSLILAAATRISKGQPITGWQTTQLQVRRQLLLNEDRLFTTMNFSNNVTRINHQAKYLPKDYSVDKLNQLATELGAKKTTNNSFGIDNHFYKSRIQGPMLGKLRNSQRGFNYTQSPEYSDFELMLSQFADAHMQVLFIIPPVNSRWMKYTGLSEQMLQTTDNKIKTQLTSQGFTNIVDMSKDGDQPYFMTDTIHLGWRGWLKVDESVKPFLTQKHLAKTHYHINNAYFKKTWQWQK